MNIILTPFLFLIFGLDEPSRWDSQIENIFVNRRRKKRVECPSGTVPILRTEKENVIYSQEYLNHHLTFLTAQYPGTHVSISFL